MLSTCLEHAWSILGVCSSHLRLFVQRSARDPETRSAGSTFGGNPLACALARAALRVLVDEGMIENAALQSVRFLDGLRSVRANTVREVRGRGLMLAVDLLPEAGGARRYCEVLQSRGILAKDTHEHMICVVPPLAITSDQLDWAMDRFGATLRQDLS